MAEDGTTLANDDIDALLAQAASDADSATALIEADEPDAPGKSVEDGGVLANDDIAELLNQAANDPNAIQQTVTKVPEDGNFLGIGDLDALVPPDPAQDIVEAVEEVEDAAEATNESDAIDAVLAAATEVDVVVEDDAAIDDANEGIQFDENELDDGPVPTLDEEIITQSDDDAAPQMIKTAVTAESIQAAGAKLRDQIITAIQDFAANTIIRFGRRGASLSGKMSLAFTCIALATFTTAVLTLIASLFIGN